MVQPSQTTFLPKHPLITVLLFLLFGSAACTQKKTDGKEKKITLPGKIAVSIKDTCYIYDNESAPFGKFKIKDDGVIEYSSFSWLQKSDLFAGTIYYKKDLHNLQKADIALYNMSGELIDTLYKSNPMELADNPNTSSNDSLLLFRITRKPDISQHALANFQAEKMLVIMEFKTKKIIQQLEKFPFEMEDSQRPWIYSENRFLFTIPQYGKIMQGNKQVNSQTNYKPGVYLYDVSSKKETFLIPRATMASSNPAAKMICYVHEEALYVRDLSSNTDKLIFQTKQSDHINHIDWSPDGKYIYMIYHNREAGSEEILIDPANTKEVPFINIKHGFQPYTWK